MEKDVFKIILLHGIREDFLDMLDLLGKGDISKEILEKIVDLCRRYLRGSSIKKESRQRNRAICIH